MIPKEKEHNFRLRNLCFYFTHRANRFIVLDKTYVHCRKHTIMCHESQFASGEDLGKILRYLKIRSRIFGALGKHEKEGFFVFGEKHLHSFPEVNRY
ncbi:MAG: hypothetical protein ACOX16_01020 [Candidatus Izemoplasmatales bacterium]|jgi:hypothetical protein